MKLIEDQLPSSAFLRIHKSYIVSKEFITSIRKTSVFIENIELSIGDTFKDVISKYVKDISNSL